MPPGAGGFRMPSLGGGFGGGGRPRGLFGSVFFSVTVLLITWSIFDAISGSTGGGLTGDILGRKHKQAITGDIPDRISDVIGVDDVLDQVKELVEFLQNPEKYREMGASIPRGVMLTGPPGTGKTLIARAIAGEAGVNFLWCSAADFDEIYVGTGSRRIRDLFQDARSKAPCIIFIDEIDALGKRNQAQNSSRNTINSILVEMDGFQASDNVMVMAATNFADLLDEALIRPGRFDYQLALRAPDYEGRIKLFQHYINKIKHDGKVDCERLASAIMGATGADVKTIVNNAAIRAAARNAKTVTHEDVEEAQEQFVMGVKITTKAIDVAAATRTAYHEAGHALLAILMPGSDPIFKATILPRGQALGHVAFAGNDKLSITRTELEARLVCAMGGRAAEELIFGEEEVSTGCSNDLEQANKYANQMIKAYGFGGRTGKVVIGKETSGDLKTRADKEVEDVVNAAYQTAKQLLIEHHLEHDRLSRALLKYEMLTSEDIQKVIKGEELEHKKPNNVEPVLNITEPNKYSLFKPNGHGYNVKLNRPDREILIQGSKQVELDLEAQKEFIKNAAKLAAV
jgi:ATP-dependent metalloprotease